MHEAYKVFSAAKIPEVPIESMTGYENFIVLGTRLGHVLRYSIHHNDSDDSKVDIQLLDYDKNFSKKPIIQIQVVPESQLIFSLSDSQIHVNDIGLHYFPLVYSEPKTRGASLFTLKVEKSTSTTKEVEMIIMICVAVKKKLQFYYWKKNIFVEFMTAIDVHDVPKVMAWYQDYLCVGFKSDYVLYKIEDPIKRFNLFPTRSTEPCVTIINKEYFALSKDEFSITVDPKAATAVEKDYVVVQGSLANLTEFDQRAHSKSIGWSAPLQTMIWDAPYAIGLMNDCIEVRTLDNSQDSLVQKINDLPRARLLIRTSKGVLIAASVSFLWQIKAVEIPIQIERLLETKDFKLALKLVDVSDELEIDKQIKKNELHETYAYYLFESKQFEESMKEFLKVNIDPRIVIKLFPNMAQDGANSTNWDDRDLENGLMALTYYLADVRRNIKPEKKEEHFGKSAQAMLAIIDTTMLKCYLQTNDSMVAPLLRLNYCHLEESERLLKKYQKYRELKILYQTKGQHKMVLDLLKNNADNKDSGLYGHDHTIMYLQELGVEHKALIFEYSSWVLDKFPEDGLQIFTEDIPDVERPPLAEVLDYLLKYHKKLVIPYLEHVIHVWDEKKSLFHNILIQQYRDNSLTAEGREQTELRDKLLVFLKSSTKYNPEIVIKDFPKTYIKERIEILSKWKQHRQALELYIQVLGEFEKAFQYCNQVYKSQEVAEEPENSYDKVYFTLIDILLSNPDPEKHKDLELNEKYLDREAMIEYVLEILTKHGTKVNAQAVLDILPNDIPLHRLKVFLETALHYQLEQKRKTQILKYLLSEEVLLKHEERIRQDSNSVTISEFSVCLMCRKRFTNQSAFVRYPNGDIVHFSCQQQKI